MAGLYAARPGAIRIYIGRTLSSDGRKARGGSCATVIYVLAALFGVFITALEWYSPQYRDFFARHGQTPGYMGLPLVIPAVLALVFSSRRVFIEFRRDSGEVVRSGFVFRTVAGTFADFGDIRLESTEVPKRGKIYIYVLSWKNDPSKLPLPLSPLATSPEQLDVFTREVVPMVREMLGETRDAAVPAPKIPAVPKATKPFFHPENGVWTHEYKTVPAACGLLGTGLAAWAVMCGYSLPYRALIIAGALLFEAVSWAETVRVRINPQARTVTVTKAFGVWRRTYPFEGFGVFYVFFPFNMVEVRLQPVRPPGPTVDIGSFFSWARAKEAAEETAGLMGIDLRQPPAETHNE